MVKGTRLKVLVIDDAETTGYTASHALTRAGFDVSEAATGRDGLRLIGESPDLILLDVNLPDVNGLELCAQVRQNPSTCSIPLIQMSATAIASKDQVLGLDSGADAYLTHPVAPEVLVATAHAIIRMRQAEKALKAALAEQVSNLAELKNERELREQFVNALSHDLRTPLTAAKMGAQLCSRMSDRPEEVQKHAARITVNIDRVDRMVGDLLDASRVRAGERLALNLVHQRLFVLLKETLDDLTTVHGSRFIHACDESIEGFWDAGGLKRTIENLCNNAIKFGNPHEPVRVTAGRLGDEVTISVHNRGNPIEKGELPRLFDRHKRSHSSQSGGQQGWGLGLTVVKGFSESHGGSVCVASSQDGGTIFTVRIPLDSRPFLEKRLP